MFYDDSVKVYDVEPWRTYGFGVPAFGDNTATANRGIANLVDEIGRAQLGIMVHIDARRRKPPSVNTMRRLFKLLKRFYDVLNARRAPYSQQRLEGGHVSPSYVPFILHPVPYFNSEYTKNKWLSTYNELIMVALSHMMQHSDNAIPFDITEELVREVWQYAKRIKVLAATELLQVPREQAEDDAWWPGDEEWRNYDPMKVITSFEALDDPGPYEVWTEDQLRPLLTGIPAHVIKIAEPPHKVFFGVKPSEAESGGGQQGGTGGTNPIPAPEV